MKIQIKVRKYTSEDANALAHIYYHTIHNVNIKDYSQEQVDVWAPQESLELTGWVRKWQALPPIVAECDRIIVGFAEFEDDGHIDCFYCHHEWQGVGVGKAMMAEILVRAKKLRITRIYAEVSITAKPFFEKAGFNVVKQQAIVRNGIELTNFVMERNL